MRSITGRAVGVVLIAIAVALFFVLRDDGDSDSESTTATSASGEPAAETIAFRNGEPVGGIEGIEVTMGKRVRFTVTSDVAGEVHVHGYEIEKAIKAGGSASFEFPADIDGMFEIELHLPDAEPQIGVLIVQPG